MTNIFPWQRNIYAKDKNGEYLKDEQGQMIVQKVQWYLGYEAYVMIGNTRKKVRKNISIAKIDSQLPNTKSGALKALKMFNPPGVVKSNQNIYFSEFTDILMREISTSYRKSTETGYKLTIKAFIELIGDKPLKMYNYDNIVEFKNLRSAAFNKSIKDKSKQRTLSPFTINIDLRYLNHIFQEAIKYKYITENPCQNVEFRSVPKAPKACFKNSQLEQILPALPRDIDRRIAVFSLATACRIGEVVNIEWSDIEYAEDNKAYVNIRNKADFNIKDYEERRIPLTTEIINMLHEMKEEQGNIIDIKNYIWGRKQCKYTISHYLTRVLRSLGYPKTFSFHSFRHTAITNWIKAGVPLPQVQKWAGHSDIETTMGYVHMDDNESVDKVMNLSYGG